MKICLLDIYRPGDNRDYNGGYGTTFQVGQGIRAKLLTLARSTREFSPLVNYGYISATLKKNGHSVFLGNNTTVNGSDLVILHASLIRHQEELACLKELRNNTKTQTCLVGPLASKCPEKFEGLADTIICGYPESAFLGIKTINDLPIGVVQAPLITDLDVLPFPDWSIYDYQQFAQRTVFDRSPSCFILGSRSCPYLCNYCPYIVFPKSYLLRNTENVVNELIHLKEHYGFRSIMFRDPVFSLKRNWVVDLCEKINSAKINLELGCETRTDALDEELLDSMYHAGFRALKVGIESADVEMIAKYKRRAPEQIHQEKMIRYAERIGMRVVAFYILGLYEDTMESMKRTLRYAKTINSSFANFTICTPIPGTEFYEQVKSEIVDLNWNHYDNFHPVMQTKYLSSEEIKRFQEKALVSYYYRPGFLKKYIKRTLGL